MRLGWGWFGFFFVGVCWEFSVGLCFCMWVFLSWVFIFLLRCRVAGIRRVEYLYLFIFGLCEVRNFFRDLFW